MMLWKIRDENTKEDETNENVSGKIEYWERRDIDIHGEDEVENVWGGEVGASTASCLIYLVWTHGEGSLR